MFKSQSIDTSSHMPRKMAKSCHGIGRIEQLETRCLLNARRVWTIQADRVPDDPNDQIVIERDPGNSLTLRAIINGEVVGTRPERKVKGIRIYSGNGSDTVRVDESVAPIFIPVSVYAGNGDDQVSGGSGNDLLEGGSGRDSLQGGDGADRLRGGSDANRLEGGGGSDSLRGGSGNDTMWGGAGNDLIEGMGGRDRLQGGDGADVIRGGIGDDTLIAHGDDPGVPNNSAIRAMTAEGEDSAHVDILDGEEGDNVLVGGDEDQLENGRPPERLEHVGSCAEVSRRLIENAQVQYNWYFEGGWGRPGGDVFITLDSVRFGDFTAAAVQRNDTASNPTFSDTNTQELGVDEADIVKTNGHSVYLLRDQELIVIDALPAEEAQVVSRSEIEGYPIDMFLRGDRVMIFSQVWGNGGIAKVASLLWDPGPAKIKITVLDISNPEAPAPVHESYLDGTYVNARMVDGQVYLVMNNSPRLPSPWIHTFDQASEVESPAHFKQRLAALDPESLLPRYRAIDYLDTGTAETEGDLIVDCDGVYATSNDDWMNLTTVLSYDLDAEIIGGPKDSATVFGYISTVYASTDNLYLINHTGDSTGIHKVALGDDIRVVASGEVPGSVLNQFSLDEHGAYFRIATTTDWWDEKSGQPHSANNVFVLSPEGDTLNVVGSIEELAPDERIYSARFFDEHGFVVTFRQVDPLFALDLSDPTDPKVAGELKIPGYSSYLHAAGPNHLLAIGRDATDQGRVQGLQVSLFDVSDLTDPKLADQFLIEPDGQWSWSGAEWDHHAFSYFAESGVLVIPVDGGSHELGTWKQLAEFWVFQVDLNSGFDLLGQVEHGSNALRSLRINESLYTLARDEMKIQPLLDPTATINKVSLEE